MATARGGRGGDPSRRGGQGARPGPPGAERGAATPRSIRPDEFPNISRGLRHEIERATRAADLRDAMKATSRALEAEAAGDAAEARRAAVRAKNAAPRSATIRGLLGRAAYALGEWHEAAQELQAYRRMSGDRRVDAMIADCYRNEGRPERAIEFLEDLPRTHEDTWLHAQAVRALAVADQGRPEQALALLRRVRPRAKATRDGVSRVVDALRELEARSG